VAAYQYAETGLPVCAISTPPSEVATATYQKKYGKWQQLVKADIVTVEHLCNTKRRKRHWFLREFLPAAAGNKRPVENKKAVMPPQIPDFKRASFL